MKRIIAIVFFTVLICLCTNITYKPVFSYVSITLQLAPVLMAAAVLGPVNGVISCMLYIFAGVLGFPVFSETNSGLSYVLGQTGGFIVGLVPCAFITGKVSRYLYQSYGSFFMQFASLFVSMSFGAIAVYILGALHFYVVKGGTLAMSMLLTVMPLIWADLFIITFSAYISRQLLHLFGEP